VIVCDRGSKVFVSSTVMPRLQDLLSGSLDRKLARHIIRPLIIRVPPRIMVY
jgi:hypothetical protein